MSCYQKPTASTATVPPQLVEIVAALPKNLIVLVEALPNRLMAVAAEAPVYSDRKAGAGLITNHVIPVSSRSLEVWPLPWQHANGKAISPTIAMLAVAYDKLASAPVIMGGRSPDAQEAAA